MYSGWMCDFLSAMKNEKVQKALPTTFSEIRVNADGDFLVYGTGYLLEGDEVEQWMIITREHRVLHKIAGWKSKGLCWEEVIRW